MPTKEVQLISLFVLLFFVASAMFLLATMDDLHSAEQAEAKLVVEFLDLKNELEQCHNRSTDPDIRMKSFDMLLSHTIHQDVPHDEMRKMIKTCKAALA